MSVYLSDRGENKFEVLVKARELAVYTIQITHNKNVFSDYDTIVNDLQTERISRTKNRSTSACYVRLKKAILRKNM